jgi:hypothetical protein
LKARSFHGSWLILRDIAPTERAIDDSKMFLC